MRALLLKLLSFLKDNKGVVLTFGIRGTGMFLGLLSGIILARLLGPENYGLYALAMAWLTSLSVIGAFGYDISTLRFIGIFNDQKKEGLISSFLKQAQKETLLFSLVIALFLYLISCFFEIINTDILWYVLCGVPLFSYLLIRMAALRAFGEYILAIGADNFLRNFVLVCVFGGLFLTKNTTDSFSANAPLIAVLCTTLLGIIIVDLFLKRFISFKIKTPARISQEDKNDWRKSSITLMMVNISRLILGKIDMAIIPIFMSVAFAGIYDAAIKWVSLIWFAQNTLVRVFGPQLAAYHANNDMENVKTHTKKITYMIFIPSAFIAFFIFIAAEFLMGIYGDYFTQGVTTLRILIIGYFLTAFAGAAHILINMLGDEKISMRISIETLLLNIGLNIILIPLYGMEGAATATSISLIFMSAKRVYFLYKKHKINCLPFVK